MESNPRQNIYLGKVHKNFSGKTNTLVTSLRTEKSVFKLQ